MNTVQKFSLFLALFGILSGCTSYRPAVVPGTETVGQEAAIPVEQGSKVKVRLYSGETIKGEVSQMVENGLFVGGSKIDFNNIESVEIAVPDDSATGQLIGATIVVGIGVSAAIGLATVEDYDQD